MLKRRTPVIRNENGISELKTITIGGIQQWACIRGNDKSKPILLFLHGGPGIGQIGIIRDYQQELEKHFVVVNWDQRGAGLSYTKEVTTESMTIDQMLRDTIELTRFLLKEFEQEKIYLIGHSWGTILGLLAIHKHPEYYHHYFGVSQVINMGKVEELSYQQAFEKAKEQKHSKAISQLSEIGKPPWNNLKYDRIHQKYLEEFGGGISHDGKLVGTFIKKMLRSKEYRLLDLIRYMKGQYFSITHLLDELRRLELSESIRQVKVPLTLMMGNYDMTVPAQHARCWFDSLDSNEKSWVWFEHSAHSPLFEENQKFIDLVLAKTI